MSIQSLENLLKFILPNFFFERYFFNLLLWQWISLVVAFCVAYFLSDVLARLTVFAGRRIFAQQTRNIDKQLVKRTFRPIRLIYLAAMIAIVLPYLGLRTMSVVDDKKTLVDTEALFVIKTGLKLLTVLGFTWLSFLIFDIVMAGYAQRLIQRNRANVIPTLPLFRRAGKVAIVIIAAVVGVRVIYDGEITAFIAGLSVFGVALAWGSQKTLENLFGGLMLILDQPIRVGQECKFGNYQGIVEDIGLRSTQIRTSDRSVVVVPNGEFSQLQIENLSKRDRIRFLTTFGLRYETSPDQLRAVLIGIRETLYAHPKVDREPARVRFVNFGSQSLDIEVSAYILTCVNNEFLAVKEDLLLRIMDIVHKNGTAFAVPVQIMYQHEHEFLDAAGKERAEAKVAQMRASGQLPLPEFSDESIQKLDDTLAYPPLGSQNFEPGGRYS